MFPERKILAAVVFFFLVHSGSAAVEGLGLDSEISQSCDTDYEPVISMANPESKINNPGPPDMYEYNLCVRGISESAISTSCETPTAFYISSKNRTAHFSEQNSYYWNVCTGRMRTRISSGPAKENETSLFSVSDRHNGHVAEPDLFDYNVYGTYKPPENVTLELEFNLSSSDDVYFDDEEVIGEQSFGPPAVFPYMVSESGSASTLSGVVTSSFTKASRTYFNSKNRLSITTQGDRGFMIPLTRGDVDNIEDEEDSILNKRFANSLNPNFGFTRISTPNVKVRLTRTEILSNLSISTGPHQVNVTKTGENQVTIEEVG